MRLLKQKAEKRRERIAEINGMEELCKTVENDLYNCLRIMRYRLPHYRKDVVFLDAGIYTRSLSQEYEIDELFDRLDEAVAERKRKFREERNDVYRS